MSAWEHSLRVAMMIKPPTKHNLHFQFKSNSKSLLLPSTVATTATAAVTAVTAHSESESERGNQNRNGHGNDLTSIIPPSSYANQTYSHPVELLDIYKTLSDLAGLPQPQLGVSGDSLVKAFSNPAVEVKKVAGAISQTTRCRLNATGVSGSRYIDDSTKDKYYAACVRTDRTKFAFMGYSLRTAQWRYTFWARWLPSMHPDLVSSCQCQTITIIWHI